MAINLEAAAVGITVIVLLCTLFWRLGRIEATKADKQNCVDRAKDCNARFIEANGWFNRLDAQQKAMELNLNRQIVITERLEQIVTAAAPSWGTGGKA